MPNRFSHFKPGDKVVVIAGPFATFEGVVEVVDGETQQVTVLVQIFGHPTPLALTPQQIELL